MAIKRKNDSKTIIYIIILIVMVLIIAIFKMNQHKSQKIEVQEEKTEQQLQEEENENIVETLYSMEERERMEFYFGRFLGYIENEEYEKAYNLLYDEFKNNYFPNLEEFKEYIQNIFSEVSRIRHDNIERNGDVYVLWIYITDAINGKPGEEKKMNIVIKENDYNDFVLSFSVI